ncbi:TPA: plasmid-related protein, partial [Vibrio cholerae]
MNNENHLNKYSDCSFDSFYERYKKARNSFLESDIKLSECEKKFKLVDIFNNLDKDGDVLYRKNKLASDSKVFSWISSLRNKASIIQAYNNLEYKGINKQDILELV